MSVIIFTHTAHIALYPSLDETAFQKIIIAKQSLLVEEEATWFFTAGAF